MPIDMLPDDVLLEIFDFCVDEQSNSIKEIEAWQTLVHVCRQWRTIVFGSPRRLNLRLCCTTKTQIPLDVWPALPLHLQGSVYNTEEFDNAIAVLERSDRVCHIGLSVGSSFDPSDDSHLENVVAAMQKPFPELTHLLLFPAGAMTVVPDSFLGGSAPNLQFLSIPFPCLPKLLLSATHLRNLNLQSILHSNLPAIIMAVSTLTSLGSLCLGVMFRDGESRHPPPLTRSVLPVLTTLEFKGASKYFEDIVARIDTPQLTTLRVTFFNQLVFDTPQFTQFFSRTPTLKAFKEARLSLMNSVATITLSPPTGTGYKMLDVGILCIPDQLVSLLERVCTSSLSPLSALEDLYIYEVLIPSDWRGNVENTLWLELLHVFSAVKNLYLCKDIAPRIALPLQELVGGRTMEVLPFLQNIFLEGLQPSGPAQEGIVKFVAARQISGHPISVSLWERDSDRVGHGLRG